MNGRSSRNKGARGEREFRDLLLSHGFEARRYGRNERASSDIAHNVSGIHFEVKRRNGFDPVAWIRQARTDASSDEVPVVAWKRNNGEWMVILGADEFLQIMADLLDKKKGAAPAAPGVSLSPQTTIAHPPDVEGD